MNAEILEMLCPKIPYWQLCELLKRIDLTASKGEKIDYSEYCLVDVLASERGWKPLVLDEKMVVTENGKRFEITRVQ